MSQMTLIFVVLLTVCAVMAVPTNSRIMGGEDVSPANSIPHMVSNHISIIVSRVKM